MEKGGIFDKKEFNCKLSETGSEIVS